MNRFIKQTMILALALAMSLGAWAQTTVTWTEADLIGSSDQTTFTKDGVTITCSDRISGGMSFNGPVTISTTLGNFTSIAITGAYANAPTTADGFTNDGNVSTWTGNAASISTPASIAYAAQFVFTIAADPSPTVTHNTDGSWGFTMPDYNAALNVTYYSLPDLAWTYNSADMPAAGLTAYRGFELPVIGGIGASMDQDFLNALLGGTVSLRYGSVNGVVTFNNPNDMRSFNVNGPGRDTIYMVFAGNDDFLYDSASFAINILNPDTLTLAADGNGTVSPLMGGLTAITTPDPSWTSNNDDVTASDLPGFQPMTRDEAIAFGAPSNEGSVYVLYTIEDGEFIGILWENGVLNNLGGSFRLSAIEGLGNAFNFYYTATGGTDIVATDVEGQYLVIHGAEVQVVAEAQDGNYVSAWSDNRQPQHYTSDTNTITVSGSMNLTATFAQNPLLTLGKTGNGTVELDGVTPSSPVPVTVTIAANGNTRTVENVNLPYTFRCDYQGESGELDQIIKQLYALQSQGNCCGTSAPAVSGNSNVTAGVVGDDQYITISAPFEGTATVTGQYWTNYYFDDFTYTLTISVSPTSYPAPVCPDGIAAGTTENTYRVLPGTQLSVTATPAEGSYLAQWSDGTQTEPVEGDARLGGSHPYTMPAAPATLTATFNEIPVLTLASNNSDWGKVEMPLVASPETLLTTINASGSFTSGSQTFDNVATVTLAGQTTYEWSVWMSQYGDGKSGTITLSAAEGVNVTGYKLYFNYADPYTITASSATLNLYSEGGGRYVYYLGGQIGNEGITKIEVYGTVSTIPAGVEQLTADTYRVLPGTEVTVNATPDEAHYFVNWDEETALNSNTAVEKTLTMGTDDTELTANFQAKPVLTLAQNDGGEMEIVPAGMVSTGIVQLTDNTYRMDYGTEVKAIATANAGYHMDSWSNQDEVAGLVSDTTETITMTEDMTITATFAQNPTLTIVSNNSEWGSLDIEGVGSGKDKFVTDANQLVYTGRHVKVTATDLYDIGVIRLKNEGQQATIETLNGEIIDSIVVTASMNTHNCSYVLSTSGTVQGGNPTTKIKDVNATSVVLTAQYGVGISNITVYYTSPDKIDVVAIDYESGTYSVLPGTEVSVNATANEGYYVTGWQDENNSDMATATYSEGLYPVTSTLTFTVTGDTTSMAIFEQSFISPEFAWSTETFIAYTMIDFNSWKPTLNNPQDLTVRYGCVEGSVITEGGIPVDETTGIIGSELGIGTVSTKAGTYHIYAVHDFDGNYDYDSVVYTLIVENSATVFVQKNIEEGGAVDFVEPENDLTHNYMNSAALKSVFLAPGADFSVTNTAAEGYHFAKWQTGDNVNGYTDYSTEPNLTYTAPTEFAGSFVEGLKAVFDTNVYNVAYNVQNDTRPQIGTNAPMGSVVLEGQHKHFLNDVLTATAAEGYIFAGWANTSGTVVSTENPFVFSPVSDTTLTATFIVGDYTLSATPNIPTSGQVTGSGSYAYRSTVTLEATPSTGYHFVNWVDGSGNVLGTSTELSVQLLSDSSVTAVFDTNVYNVAYNVQNDIRPQIGTNAPMGSVVLEGQHKHFLNDVLTATAADGYIFTGWANASGTVVSTLNPFAFSPVSDTTLTATFTASNYTLSATPNIPTSGQVTGSGSYAYRSNATLEVVPSAGYHLVEWTDAAGNVLGTEPTLTVNVMSDTTVIAVLDTNVYNVMANVNIVGLGTVTGAGQVKHFLSTDLVATANPGYHFVNWIDNAGNELGTANTITVFPVSDTVLTAVFEANIYTTVWSGNTTTTYNSQPYTGLVATYTDFWGNEHTPMLTFTNGSTTITTPNYPVNAGTWTVTATGEVGDVLTNTVNTLVINPAVVYVSNAVVETAKFVDGNTDAVVTNIGTLNNVQGNDVVTHNTTAVFNDATVGEGKTITLTYSLNGDTELLANYNLDPVTQVYTTNAYIIEPMTPDTNRVSTEDTTVVEEGMDIYAYGYCSGSTYSIRYHLNSGNPDQYKIDFADNRFTDVDWTDLAIAGTDGTIDIEVPVDLPTGDYTLTVTFRDSRFTWLESKPISVSFHVNLPETYTVVLFDNVIALVDTCHCFTDIQWYHRADASSDWYAIPGANGYYYHATDAQLKGEFFVKVRMNGIETYTCPQTDMETLYSDNEQSVSVKAYPNPTTERVTIAISGSIEPVHKLRIINNLGVEMESSTFEGDSTVINMSNYQQGNYMVTVDGAVVIVIRN